MAISGPVKETPLCISATSDIVLEGGTSHCLKWNGELLKMEVAFVVISHNALGFLSLPDTDPRLMHLLNVFKKLRVLQF